ncbi:RICIN domain-containing protein [Kitasatospora sp. NBC_00374]|uniref:RICIN domain-containing protein n=1 Tax=Kitasatospora sp. NBC_00374 TaxID=2975964 RepID=UPI003255697A
MGIREAAPSRRKLRGLLVVAASVAAGLVASVIGIGAVSEGDRPQDTIAAGEIAVGQAVAAASPAAVAQRKEKPKPIGSIPGNEPDRGLVFDGLAAAAQEDPCVGVFTVSTANQCSHGPDEPPKGVDIKKDTPPVVDAAKVPALAGAGDGRAPSAADLLAAAPPVLDVKSGSVLGGGPVAAADAADAADGAGPGGVAGQGAAAAGGTVACEGDGVTGNRVQVLYVHTPGHDRFAQYLSSFKRWAAEADVIYNASAAETGGVRHIRYVTAGDCTASVLDVELPAAAMANFGETISALSGQGYNRKDRKYMIFGDSEVYCGIGTFNGDERPGQDNLSNFGPSFGRTDSGCWGGHTPAHELGHNLGAVNNSAPNSTQHAHCVDESDVMCYGDFKGVKMQTKCPDQAHEDRLDCNHDDYYHTNPAPGSYLSNHWNIANNQFLIRGGGDPNPNPSPTAKPSPNPTKPTPNPTPSPTGGTTTGGATTGPVVTAGQLTQNSVLLSWPQVAGAADYELQVDGKSDGTVRSTVVRLVQLEPNTEYKIAIAPRDSGGRVGKAGPVTRLRTLAAAADGAGPTRPGTPYVVVNSLTGQAADLWGGSADDGAALIAFQRHGYGNQQWLFEDAGNGRLRIRSASSKKCLQAGDAVAAGQFVMQQPCNAAAAAQQWELTAGGSGYSLKPAGSSLVLGVSKRWYYGGWQLELQQPSGQLSQNWTVQQAG